MVKVRFNLASISPSSLQELREYCLVHKGAASVLLLLEFFVVFCLFVFCVLILLIISSFLASGLTCILVPFNAMVHHLFQKNKKQNIVAYCVGSQVLLSVYCLLTKPLKKEPHLLVVRGPQSSMDFFLHK